MLHEFISHAFIYMKLYIKSWALVAHECNLSIQKAEAREVSKV